MATSLAAEGYDVDNAALEAALTDGLRQAFRHLCAPETYVDEYRRLCLTLGRKVRIVQEDETVTALDIDGQYGLTVRRESGEVETLRCGEVSVRGLYGYAERGYSEKECCFVKGLLELFLTFAKVGVMTFGGGMAMLPILQREVVENKGWATDEELTDYFAIGQCTPGIIAVNTATFIGQKQKGVWGGIVATLGVVFPSLIIITVLAGLITSFSHLEWVQNAFAGIRVCVCVLIFNAILKLWQGAVKDIWGVLIFAAVLAASLLTEVSPVLFVLAAAVAGIVIRCVGGAKK